LFAWLRFDSLVPRFAAALLLTPMVLSAGAISIAQAAGIGVDGNANRAERESCFRTASYAPLAKLATGLAVADIDFGPFLLALTPHAVLAAPYHRLSAGIVGAHEVFASPPEEAHRIATHLRAAYIVLCGARPPSDMSDAEREASLWSRLQAGDVPDWLDAEPLPGPFRVYRVRR
jgi:hypothetical protein